MCPKQDLEEAVVMYCTEKHIHKIQPLLPLVWVKLCSWPNLEALILWFPQIRLDNDMI